MTEEADGATPALPPVVDVSGAVDYEDDSKRDVGKVADGSVILTVHSAQKLKAKGTSGKNSNLYCALLYDDDNVVVMSQASKTKGLSPKWDDDLEFLLLKGKRQVKLQCVADTDRNIVLAEGLLELPESILTSSWSSELTFDEAGGKLSLSARAIPCPKTPPDLIEISIVNAKQIKPPPKTKTLEAEVTMEFGAEGSPLSRQVAANPPLGSEFNKSFQFAYKDQRRILFIVKHKPTDIEAARGEMHLWDFLNSHAANETATKTIELLNDAGKANGTLNVAVSPVLIVPNEVPVSRLLEEESESSTKMPKWDKQQILPPLDVYKPEIPVNPFGKYGRDKEPEVPVKAAEPVPVPTPEADFVQQKPVTYATVTPMQQDPAAVKVRVGCVYDSFACHSLSVEVKMVILVADAARHVTKQPEEKAKFEEMAKVLRMVGEVSEKAVATAQEALQDADLAKARQKLMNVRVAMDDAYRTYRYNRRVLTDKVLRIMEKMIELADEYSGLVNNAYSFSRGTCEVCALDSVKNKALEVDKAAKKCAVIKQGFIAKREVLKVYLPVEPLNGLKMKRLLESMERDIGTLKRTKDQSERIAYETSQVAIQECLVVCATANENLTTYLRNVTSVRNDSGGRKRAHVDEVVLPRMHRLKAATEAETAKVKGSADSTIQETKAIMAEQQTAFDAGEADKAPMTLLKFAKGYLRAANKSAQLCTNNLHEAHGLLQTVSRMRDTDSRSPQPPRESVTALHILQSNNGGNPLSSTRQSSARSTAALPAATSAAAVAAGGPSRERLPPVKAYGGAVVGDARRERSKPLAATTSINVPLVSSAAGGGTPKARASRQSLGTLFSVNAGDAGSGHLPMVGVGNMCGASSVVSASGSSRLAEQKRNVHSANATRSHCSAAAVLYMKQGK